MPIPSIFGFVFASVFFLATVGLPLLLTLYAMTKSFLTRGRSTGRPFESYVARLYDGGKDPVLSTLMGLLWILLSIVVGFLGVAVGELYLAVGLYTLSPFALVAALFLLRFLLDVGHGLKHNKETGKLEEVDKLLKRIEEIERGEKLRKKIEKLERGEK